jgi:hypothetical protein
LVPILNSCGTSTTTGGAGGGAGAVVGPKVGSSSPPIMSIADDEDEQHIIKPSTPIMATCDIYDNLIFFLVKDLKSYLPNGKL